MKAAAAEAVRSHRAGRASGGQRGWDGARSRTWAVGGAAVAAMLVAGAGWFAWEARALRERNSELEALVSQSEEELTRAAEAAEVLRRRAEAEELASGGWPTEPPVAAGTARSTGEEMPARERLVPHREAVAERGPDDERPTRVPLAGPYWISSGLGWREDPRTGKLRYHPGLDLAAPKGTPVVATAGGWVLWAGRYPKEKSATWWNHGNLVVLRHADAVTLYAHLDEVEVVRGTRVVRGETLGSVGTTGVTTGPHLHYEVRQRDEAGVYLPVDPRAAALR